MRGLHCLLLRMWFASYSGPTEATLAAGDRNASMTSLSQADEGLPRWQLGAQSRRPPVEIMRELFRVLKQLNFVCGRGGNTGRSAVGWLGHDPTKCSWRLSHPRLYAPMPHPGVALTGSLPDPLPPARTLERLSLPSPLRLRRLGRRHACTRRGAADTARRCRERSVPLRVKCRRIYWMG